MLRPQRVCKVRKLAAGIIQDFNKTNNGGQKRLSQNYKKKI
jgi:hypothetical protein